MKNILSVLLLFFLYQNSTGPEVKHIEKLSTYPKSEKDYYFRPIIDLARMGSQLIGVENLSNKLIVFDFDPVNWISVRSEIGRAGEGPGDLMHPFTVELWGDEIAVKSSRSFSFFTREGRYISRFKVFGGGNSFCYINGLIYWLNPNIEEDHLIEIFNKDGKRIGTIGNKYLKVDISSFKNPYRTITEIYEGSLFFDDNHLYYINSRFGDIFKYSFDGKLLSRDNICNVFQERGKVIHNVNTDEYFLKKKVADYGGFSTPYLYDDMFQNDKELFFISTQIKRINSKDQTVFHIKQMNIRTMKAHKAYEIIKDGMCRMDCAAIVDFIYKRYLLLSLTVLEEGQYIETYEL